MTSSPSSQITFTNLMFNSLTVMLLLAVVVSSILDPNLLHVMANPVPPHTMSVPQPRSVVRGIDDGRDRDLFAAAEGGREGGRGRERERERERSQ